ncbi:copper-transporting ATPase-like protein [Trypanosoma grayi]|uniref:copper-transporting ATPase-like protein n=1 Tax=Trypanosoma grayi TaxID=71804 RepID=UPI0004F41851|nr:copper-transporting ATPase-like protein [Trypanosoma grayi]KEG07326.1 copper-transporting ATPase-like protein [Trypanosoma grayi]
MHNAEALCSSGHALSASVDVTSATLQHLREQQTMGHLLRLEALNWEWLALSEKCSKFRLGSKRAAIVAAKHREAALRATLFAKRLRELLNGSVHRHHQQECTLDNFSYSSASAIRVVSSLTELHSADAQVVEKLLGHTLAVIDSSHTKNNNHFSYTTLHAALAHWLQSHYLARYTTQYLPLASGLATTHLSLSLEEQCKVEKRLMAQEAQQRQEERRRAQEARRTQLSIAKERLEKAQRNAFDLRKRLFILREWLTGQQRLPSGKLLNAIMCSEVICRIQADVAVGELEFVLQLTADNGRALNNFAA